MKKSIIKIVIGIVIYIILSLILNSFMYDEELVLSISSGVTMMYFIILSIISYIKNIVQFFKTGEFPKTASFAAFVIETLAITTRNNPGSSIVMIEGAHNSSKEFNKVNNKLGIFTYTLFYIAFWSFLGAMLYSFSIQSEGLDSISETLMGISLICIVIVVFIILLFGIFSTFKNTKSIMRQKEEEYKKLKETNMFVYDIKVFKKYYGKIYYMLAYMGIPAIILIILEFLYVEFSGNYIPTIFVFPIFTFLLFEVFYLPFFFPAIIHTLKMNSKRQKITLDPLKIRMITKDAVNEYGSYEKREKNYIVNSIESYQITDRYIIINGKIEYIICKTYDVEQNVKNKIINQLKIPRIFNNEDLFIEYLKRNLNK